MKQANPQRIVATLQTQADLIALEAASIFTRNWSGASSEGAVQFAQRANSVHGKLESPNQTSDAKEMIRDGFRRLGGVVALSVLVDEPGLIADDLHWLKRMLDARHAPFPFPAMADALLQSYAQACSKTLQPEEATLVSDLIERARKLV